MPLIFIKEASMKYWETSDHKTHLSIEEAVGAQRLIDHGRDFEEALQIVGIQHNRWDVTKTILTHPNFLKFAAAIERITKDNYSVEK